MLAITTVALLPGVAVSAPAQSPPFRVLALYSTHVEQDHVDFANDAIAFFTKLSSQEHFSLETTTDWDRLRSADLQQYRVVIWLDDFPATAAQKSGFQNYMEHGGGWLGFHIAGYQSGRAAWPWFADFLGTVFYGNSWPPMPATLHMDTPGDPLTSALPREFLSPANEWYSWEPSPRKNPDVHVLMTLDPSNYPLGFKDTLTGGDIPVTWTNTRYRMLYTNMGHGGKIFDNPQQNAFFARALLWVANSSTRVR